MERADIAGVQGAGRVGLVWDPPACGTDWWKESHRSSPSAALLLSWLGQACSHTALGNMCLRVFFFPEQFVIYFPPLSHTFFLGFYKCSKGDLKSMDSETGRYWISNISLSDDAPGTKYNHTQWVLIVINISSIRLHLCSLHNNVPHLSSSALYTCCLKCDLIFTLFRLVHGASRTFRRDTGC